MAPRSGETTGLQTEEFLKFREFFYRKTGIMFADNKRYFVDKRIRERMDAGDFNSFQSYFNAMRLGDSSRELQQLINIMTVNETHFYREEYQFRCLISSLLPEVVRNQQHGAPVRIWSVPCSTGEE
ncbi:CheR family methyltransferase, partial [Rhodoplanes sp. SY1]|uniref:CheR family methyltransferase n=1 Tax=Rhodoplanes sp. SY1 TaxID=3166646 RepID=UPI0038B44BBF